MKKKIIYALSFGMVLFFAASCGNKTGEEQNSSQANAATVDTGFSFTLSFKDSRSDKTFLDSSDFSKIDFDVVKDRLDKRSLCAGGCSTDYCGNDSCLEVIRKCHTVDSEKFEALTDGRKYEHVTISSDTISKLLSLIQCDQHFVEMASDNNSIRVSVVNSVNSAANDKAYYSAGLLKKIVDKRTIDSVVVYKGIKYNGKILMPFIVFPHNSKFELYDVSNDFP